MSAVSELLFVYNADATLAAAASDFVTRIFAPQDYACNLCMVTYGPITMKSPWKEFLDSLPNEKSFLHRDEFKKHYPTHAGEPLPAVFAVRGDTLDTLLGPEEINTIKDWRASRRSSCRPSSAMPPRRRLYRLSMRVLVWNMRWMTRYLGFVARSITKWWGAHEVIACGVRSEGGEVRIIYTPLSGHSEHRALVRGAGAKVWSSVPHEARENFSGSIVHTVAVPGAENGALLKMAGENARGRTLVSPTIVVKPETVSEPELLDIAPVPLSPDDAVLFSWPKAEANDPMIYFFALEDAYGKTCAAVYTRESFWRYPHTRSASHSVGPSAPPRLTAGETYTATLTLVDYDGWASHIARRQFSTRRVDGGTLS